MRALFLLAFSALAGTFGCINTDPAIFVDASADDASITLQKGLLGYELQGGFTLTFHLGARASGSADVSIQGFAIASEDQKTSFFEALPLKTNGATFPITVDPDADEVVKLTIDYGSDTVPKEDGDSLCSAGKAIFSGSFTDSLRGTSQPITSEAVTVLGCTP